MQRIFLIGLPGSGKSTVGQRVATLLSWKFVDTNNLLAEHASFPAHQSEERLENEVLQAATPYKGVVIAVSEGAIDSEANLAFLREPGLTVYLSTEAETAWERLQSRPRAVGKHPGEPSLPGSAGLQRLRDLFSTRRQWYEQAEIHVTTDAHPSEAVAYKVIAGALARGYLSSSDAPRVSALLRLAAASSQAVIEWGGLVSLPETLRSFGMQKRVFLVTDTEVGSFYTEPVLELLASAGLSPFVYKVPAGEASKSFLRLQEIIDWLVEQKAERHEPVLALGGGVVGDLVGFVASCYQRGVPLVQIPTTLLAQVDSAIGGKTGINHPLGKNLIGAFYQPTLIFVDPAFLLTLPERVYREGWAEIVKYGVILDAELFELLETHLSQLEARDPDLLTQVVARCVRMKMDVVQRDERDSGLRNILNYGHTFGHALEAITDYGTWLHGEAVSIGMEVAARIAVARGQFSQDDLLRQRRLLRAIDLPVQCPGADVEALLAAMQHDKKARDGRMRWILPTRIGQVSLYSDVDRTIVRDAALAVCGPREEF